MFTLSLYDFLYTTVIKHRDFGTGISVFEVLYLILQFLLLHQLPVEPFLFLQTAVVAQLQDRGKNKMSLRNIRILAGSTRMTGSRSQRGQCGCQMKVFDSGNTYTNYQHCIL